MISWQSQSAPLGYSLLGERHLRDVDALDLAHLETLVNARPRVAALLTLADLTEITSTSLSGPLTMTVGLPPASLQWAVLPQLTC